MDKGVMTRRQDMASQPIPFKRTILTYSLTSSSSRVGLKMWTLSKNSRRRLSVLYRSKSIEIGAALSCVFSSKASSKWKCREKLQSSNTGHSKTVSIVIKGSFRGILRSVAEELKSPRGSEGDVEGNSTRDNGDGSFVLVWISTSRSSSRFRIARLAGSNLLSRLVAWARRFEDTRTHVEGSFSW